MSSSEPLIDPLFGACRVVGTAQGIELRSPAPPVDNARPLSLEDLCAASGLRHRKVVLKEGWWRQEHGPLLAFRQARPVALVPRGRRYDLVDPAAGLRQPVDGTVAAGLEPQACVFYRPLQDRPLSFADLLRAGLRGLRRDFATLLLVSLSGGLLALLTPLVTRRLVDSSIVRADRPEMLHLTLALLAAALAGALFQLVRGFTVLRLKARIDISLQAALWDRLLALPASFFRRFTVGDISARSLGIDQVQNLLTGDVTGSLLALLSALFSLAILFYYHWPLALLATGMAVLFALLTAAVARHQLRHLRVLQALNGRLASLVYAFLGGIAKLRTGGAERRAFEVWAERFAEQRRCSVRLQRLSNVLGVAGTVYGAGASLALFAAAFIMAALSARTGIGLGELLAFNAAYAQFQAAVLAVASVVPTLLAFVPTYERLRPILETVPEGGAGQADPGPLRGGVELRNVSFRYGEGPLVLEDVSLRAEPGELVALVGPSGSGKSTCLRLMLGFERPEAGSVRIDDRELGSLNPLLVRRQTGVVLQNSRPMVGDLFHNIIGSLPLTIEDAWRAARQVGLEEEIRAMPMGMFTFVNQRGVSFSGGQRQRLLLARAIVNRPRLLLLDEATSALDNRTQDLVIRSLTELRATRILVAHRLSTLRNADRIYVLDRGRIAEQGTFDELAQQSGLFSRMMKRQKL